MVALEAVCDQLPNYKQQLQRVLNLGLIEVSPEINEENRVYRVSRILPHIIHNIQIIEAPKAYSFYQIAHEKLHQLWGNKNNKSEEKWQEIFRFKFANKDNPERFRQGFSQMLSVQDNPEADQAFELELRKCADYLVEDGLCEALANYLRQRQWRKADKETAWIFYQVMVKENYGNWNHLLNNFPCKTLQEINRLWLENSNNKFGISIQSKIYQSLSAESNSWSNFCDLVGWQKGGEFQTYNEIVNELTDIKRVVNDTFADVHLPSLPALIYTRLGDGWTTSMGWTVIGPGFGDLGFLVVTCGIDNLFSLAESCKD